MSTPTAHATSIELAQRLSVDAVIADVTNVVTVAPSLVAITLSHPDAVRLAGTAGNDVMVRLEETSEHFLRRRYSVRSVDAAAANLTLWVSTTHEGAGARWASQIAVGDGVDMVGPRGKIALNPLADWHLFVGDTTALGAFYRMAESVEPPGQVIFIVEVDHLDDAVTPALADGLGVTAIFVDRAGRLGGDPTGLLRGLATFDTPLGDGQAYVFGELAAGHAVRTALLDRGLSNDQVSLKAFWRAGVHNAEHGEPPKD